MLKYSEIKQYPFSIMNKTKINIQILFAVNIR